MVFLPALEPVSLVEQLGLMPALVLNLAVFALIAGATVVLENAAMVVWRRKRPAHIRGWRAC
ncbi:hypothetical protein MBH78_00160 [Oceanimonas sp. NS1]|nr:hypothetical protein [Oceanimonas sp. NS1]